MAQSYPSRPIKIIVSSAAGGPLDIVARAVAEKLTGSLKQAVVVEERDGAGGNIAADFVSGAPPDGYTLLFTLSTTLAVNPHLYDNLTFDLQPISLPSSTTVFRRCLCIHPCQSKIWRSSSPRAKNNGPVTYAHGGVGTSSHLVMEYFRWRAGFKTMIADLISGQVKVSFGSTAALLPPAKAGRLRALAVSTAQRSPLAPEIPTVAESGYRGFELTTDFVLMAPGGTPDDTSSFCSARSMKRSIRRPSGIVSASRTYGSSVRHRLKPPPASRPGAGFGRM